MNKQSQDNIALIKSKKFAIRVINLYKFLCDNKKEFVLSKQLLRSGTSIGANISESECAISKNDFISKIYIALKESNESLYWIELLYETEYLTKQQYISLRTDCEELKRILAATTKTLKPKI